MVVTVVVTFIAEVLSGMELGPQAFRLKSVGGAQKADGGYRLPVDRLDARAAERWQLVEKFGGTIPRQKARKITVKSMIQQESFTQAALPRRRNIVTKQANYCAATRNRRLLVTITLTPATIARPTSNRPSTVALESTVGT
jgi:hypothetical protein